MKKVAIIGGGISGLSALHFLMTRHSDICQPVLFEKESRLGGTIGTDRIGGFVSDWGPNGFLDKVPLTLQMVDELGATELLEPADSASGRRFIYAHNRLNEISASPLAFMRSPLLSLRGRLRLTAEPFIKKRINWDEDESIYDFVARRIGREAADTLIDPMVSGIFGGAARSLSLASCFPVMVEMEKEHGSLIKAMIARMKAAKKQGSSGKAGPAGPAGHLTSFKNGLVTIIEKFHEKYGEQIKTGQAATIIKKSETGFLIEFGSGRSDEFDAVICSTPAFTAAEIMSDMDGSLSRILASIPYSSIAVACLGFRREDIGHDLDGFGFLVPRTQGKRILGNIWTSSIFSGRSPEGLVQLRVMIGGASDPEAATLSDGALLDIVTGDLESILNISGPPAFVRIFKFARGIPQFTIGHRDRLKQLDDRLVHHPGLYFTGNAYDGVSLNDCVIRSDKVVKDMHRYFS